MAVSAFSAPPPTCSDQSLPVGILHSQCPLPFSLEAGLREGEFTWIFFLVWIRSFYVLGAGPAFTITQTDWIPTPSSSLDEVSPYH
jgi:hypothetical protein